MNNTTVKIAVIGTAVVLTVGYLALSKNATLDHLAERFPEIDRKIAKEAYRSIMSQSLRGKIDTTNWSTEQFDQLFVEEVARLSTNK